MVPWSAIIPFWVIVCMDAVSCYPTGAPINSCTTLEPVHPGSHPLTLFCLLHSFKGFMLQALDESNTPVGSFSFTNKLQVQYVSGCPGNAMATVTHRRNFVEAKTHKVPLQWTLGKDMARNVSFRATVVQSYKDIFTDIVSHSLVHQQVPCKPPPSLPNTERHVVGNDVVNYTCIAGYTSSAPITARCWDGKWRLPTGVCSVSCGPPPSPENTERHMVNDSVVDFTCLAGYTRAEPMRARCLAGKWHLPKSLCTAIPLPTTAPSMKTSSSSDVVTSGTSAKYIDLTITSAKNNTTMSENSGSVRMTTVNVIIITVVAIVLKNLIESGNM